MYPPSSLRLPVAVGLIVTCANLFVAYLLQSATPGTSPIVEHTYVGDSYPARWELPAFAGPVEMTFAESDAYALDGPFADALWMSNRRLSTHAGYARFGPERRVFALSMFHQLHCINTMRRALAHPDDKEANGEHVQHCLSYLRQFFLCAADDVLEPGDFTARDFSVDRLSHTRVCRDWSAVYDAAADNWDDWVQFWIEHASEFGY